MASTRDMSHWARYNAAQRSRPPRALCLEAIRLAGPGRGREAIDLGCGAGVETRALLDAGWDVTAIDGAATTEEHVRAATVGIGAGQLTIRTSRFSGLTELPGADLVYAGYSLPFADPPAFAALWAMVRSCLRPGGWFAGNFFGERDSWAGTLDGTFLTREQTHSLFTGMDVLRFDEEDADGQAFSGPKRWHVFDVVARRPGS